MELRRARRRPRPCGSGEPARTYTAIRSSLAADGRSRPGASPDLRVVTRPTERQLDDIEDGAFAGYCLSQHEITALRDRFALWPSATQAADQELAAARHRELAPPTRRRRRALQRASITP